MESLYRVPFLVLECPNLKLKKPPWVHMPSAMTVYALVVVSYFLITGGNSACRGPERLGEPARPGGASVPWLSAGESIALLSVFSEGGGKFWGPKCSPPKGFFTLTPCLVSWEESCSLSRCLHFPGLLAKRSELNSVFFKPRLLLLLLHAMSYLIKALGKSVLAHSISTVDQEGVGLLPSLSVVPGTLVDTE